MIRRTWHETGDMARAMLLTSGLPDEYWNLAYAHATLIRNVLPKSAKDFQTPWKMAYGKDFNYRSLRVPFFKVVRLVGNVNNFYNFSN